MARLEGKIERLETQLQAKERELGSVTRTVRDIYISDVWIRKTFIDEVSWHTFFGQEAKNTAALKAQNEKLQKERDEFQRMVIANQVWSIAFYQLLSLMWILFKRISEC